MKRFLILIISFTTFLTTPLLYAPAAAEPSGQGEARQEILILNSYHPGFAWSDDEQAGFIDVLRGKDENWLPVIEYLDLKRLFDGRHLAELGKLFRRKYRNKKFSVVIAIDNPALEFAIDNQAELFKNAPIVFCGINDYTPSLLKGRFEVTGITEAIDLAGTVEAMLHMHPATREIFVPHDYTVTGLAVRKKIEALIPRFGARVRFRFTDPLTMEELLKELERLPGDSLVLPISFITDKSGRTFGIRESTRLFSEHSPVPVYSTFEQRLGFGVVGGKLLSAQIHGSNAARIALRVLAGEKASVIPVIFESDSQLMFDYKVMSRFGIPLSALPAGSTVINKPVSFYVTHRVVIQAAVGVIVFMAVVIFLLGINNIQRRRSTERLRESEKKYRSLFENSVLGISQVFPDGRFIAANSAYAQMYGYANPEEMMVEVSNVGKLYANPDDRKEVLRILAETGVMEPREIDVVHRNGTRRTFLAGAHEFRDSKGNLSYYQAEQVDITERKQLEYELRRSSENFRQSLDNSPLGVRIVTEEGETIYANRTILDIYGSECLEELNTTPVKKRYTPQSYAEYEIRREKRQRGDYAPFEYEVSIIRKNGEIHHLQVFRKEVLWNGEKQFQVTYQDITERKRAEEALRENEKKFSIAFHRGPHMMAISDIETGRYLEVNEKFSLVTGFSKEETIGKTSIELGLLTQEFRKEMVRELQSKGSISGKEIRMFKKNQEPIFCLFFGRIIPVTGINRLLSLVEDITDRKQVEQALRASREQMRALAERLQAVREEERTLIAREIHDELGGALTGLKIDVSLLTRAALKIENETVRTSLLAGMDSMIKFTDTTIQTVRRIAMELRPGVLDDLGLIAALGWQLKDFEKRTGIRCELFPPGEDINLDADLSTALFRIFQEALTNVVRHSAATEVHVRLHADTASCILEIEDNGKGIEKEKAISLKSLGLLGMRERAEIFGGRITVTGTPGIGTTVTVELPPAEKRKMDRDQGGAE